MELAIFPSPMAVAQGAAVRIAALAAASIHERGRFTLALSGGSTPWAMLRVLAVQPVEWAHVHVFQVDERRAPDGDPTRNWTNIRASLADHVPIPDTNLHPMPVWDAPDVACREYARVLGATAGAPPRLDCVQLGLGGDGHTASLVPGDPILEIADRDVAWTTTEYAGTQRMTLTLPCLDRARHLVWLVTGDTKASMTRRLVDGDRSIPAGRVAQARASLFADAAAARDLDGA